MLADFRLTFGLFCGERVPPPPPRGDVGPLLGDVGVVGVALPFAAGEGAASLPVGRGRCVPGRLLVVEVVGLSCGLRSREGTEGGRSVLSGEGLRMVL